MDNDCIGIAEPRAQVVRPAHILFADTHTPAWTRAEIKTFRQPHAGAHIALLEMEESRDMAQKTVQLVIGRLLTDEDLRARFVERPRDTLTELREQGFDLTEDEIDALARSDAQVWPSMARRIHPRLQRCSLRSG